LLKAIVNQRVQAVASQHDHIATAAAIAAPRAATINELLTPESHSAGSAMAAGDMNASLVKELHFVIHNP